MKIRFNDDITIVNQIKESLRQSDGYCPCRYEHIDDTKCMCKEFRDQIADKDFEGYCHCTLYYKEK